MIGMDFGHSPVGEFVGFAVPGGQGAKLLLPEDLKRFSTSGAVDALPGHVTTPPGRGIPEVGQVPELSALEEALPHVLDAPLHEGLVLGVTHPCGVGDEATMLGVLQEAPGEPGVQSVGTGHRGREVVDDQVSGGAAEELPGGFQAGYYILQPLAVAGPDEACLE